MPLSEEAMTRYKGVLEKYPLTEKEKIIVDKAGKRFQTYVKLGGLIGLSFGAFKVFKSRSPSVIRGLLFSTGFGVIGAQIGFITGFYSARSLIYDLPDRQKFRNIVNELMNIAAEEGERNSTGLPIFRPPKGQPFAPQSSREPGLVPQVGKDNDMEDIFGASEPAPSQEGSAWDRIRNANMGKQSEWDKIRQGEADLSELQRDPATNSSSWDKVRHADSDNFFIDSALSESSGGTSNKARFSKDNISVKRNKYGDIIELPDESLKDVKYNN